MTRAYRIDMGALRAAGGFPGSNEEVRNIYALLEHIKRMINHNRDALQEELRAHRRNGRINSAAWNFTHGDMSRDAAGLRQAVDSGAGLTLYVDTAAADTDDEPAHGFADADVKAPGGRHFAQRVSLNRNLVRWMVVNRILVPVEHVQVNPPMRAVTTNAGFAQLVHQLQYDALNRFAAANPTDITKRIERVRDRLVELPAAAVERGIRDALKLKDGLAVWITAVRPQPLQQQQPIKEQQMSMDDANEALARHAPELREMLERTRAASAARFDSLAVGRYRAPRTIEGPTGTVREVAPPEGHVHLTYGYIAAGDVRYIWLADDWRPVPADAVGTWAPSYDCAVACPASELEARHRQQYVPKELWVPHMGSATYHNMLREHDGKMFHSGKNVWYNGWLYVVDIPYGHRFLDRFDDVVPAGYADADVGMTHYNEGADRWERISYKSWVDKKPRDTLQNPFARLIEPADQVPYAQHRHHMNYMPKCIFTGAPPGGHRQWEFEALAPPEGAVFVRNGAIEPGDMIWSHGTGWLLESSMHPRTTVAVHEHVAVARKPTSDSFPYAPECRAVVRMPDSRLHSNDGNIIVPYGYRPVWGTAEALAIRGLKPTDLLFMGNGRWRRPTVREVRGKRNKNVELIAELYDVNYAIRRTLINECLTRNAPFGQRAWSGMPAHEELLALVYGGKKLDPGGDEEEEYDDDLIF